MKSVLCLAGLTLAFVGCGGHPSCPGGGPQPPAGSPSDVHPLVTDAGFWLSDAGGAVRVTASGAPLRPTCHQPDGGGYIGYPDGGGDFTFPDGGLADGDGGCHVTERFLRDLATALEEEDVNGAVEELQTDGSAVERFSFTDWTKVDPAVQTVGSFLVDAGLAGPIDLVPETTFVGCG